MECDDPPALATSEATELTTELTEATSEATGVAINLDGNPHASLFVKDRTEVVSACQMWQSAQL